MNFSSAYQMASQINDNLRADDKRLNGTVQLVHEDGTFLLYQNAFIQKEENWIMAFTEHFGFHVFDSDDVVQCVEYMRNNQ